LGPFSCASDDLGSSYAKRATDSKQRAPVKEACSLFAQAEKLFDDEQATEALRRAEDALIVFREVADEEGIVDTVRLIVHCYVSMERRKEAFRIAKDELERVKKEKDAIAIAKMTLSIAEVNAEQRGDKLRVEALLSAGEVRNTFQKESAGKMEAIALMTMAGIHLMEKGVAGKAPLDASKCAGEAREIFKTKGDKKGEAIALHAIAAAHIKARNAGGKMELLPAGGWVQPSSEALQLFHDGELRKMEVYEMICIAQWHTLDTPRKALKVAGEALKLCQELGSKQEALALTTLVEAHLGINDISKEWMIKEAGQAVKVAKQGVVRLRKAKDKAGEAQALKALIQAHLVRGETKEALRTADKARAIFLSLEDKTNEAAVMALSARIAMDTSKLDKAYALADGMASTAENYPEKAVALETLYEVQVMKRDLEKALDTSERLRALAEGEGEQKKEATAKLMACNIYYMQEEFEKAVSVAREAQAILHDIGAVKEEADSLRIIGEVHTASRNHEGALRAAEKARQLSQEAKDEDGEAAMLFAIAEVRLLLLTGDDVAQARISPNFSADVEIAKEAADEAVNFARMLGMERLTACALCTTAQVFLSDMKTDSALDAAYEAMSIFRELEDEGKMASVMCVVADVENAAGNKNRAFSTVNKALQIFRKVKDPQGEYVAMGVLEHITGPPQQQALMEFDEVAYDDYGGQDQYQEQQWSDEEWWQWEQYQQYMNQQGQGQAPPPPQQDQGGAPPMPDALATKKTARTYDVNNRLDPNKLDFNSVQARLREVVLAVADVDEDEDLEMDQPLMQVGITSKSAVTLRNALSDELPGVNFPFTLVFDYPSVNAMTDLIIEST